MKCLVTLGFDASTKKAGFFSDGIVSLFITQHFLTLQLFAWVFFLFPCLPHGIRPAFRRNQGLKVIKPSFLLCRIKTLLRWCCLIIAVVCITLNNLCYQSPVEGLLAVLRLNWSFFLLTQITSPSWGRWAGGYTQCLTNAALLARCPLQLWPFPRLQLILLFCGRSCRI